MIRSKKRKNWKEGRSVTIECEAEIWVDEHLEYATTEALLEELSDRDIDFTDDIDISTEDAIKLLTNRLSITQSAKLETIIKSVLE
jgi:hypothetical protein